MIQGICRSWIVICIGLLATPVIAQTLNVPAQLSDEAEQSKVMPKFAKAVIASLDDGKSLDPASLFRLQLAAGLYADALVSLDKLRAPLASDASPRVRARYLEYVLYARAAAKSAEAGIAFETAYRDSFHALLQPLDNRTAAIVVNGLSVDNLTQVTRVFEQDLKELKGKGSISISDSLKLIRDYEDREIYRSFGEATADLIAEDDARRYVIERDIRVHTRDGATVCGMVVRPSGQSRLPALLQFTIYNEAAGLMREARRAASNDYAGVIGLTRGKGCSPDPIIPYEHDGEDAAVLIDWVAVQPWSDGRVGMYGGSYSGFTPWAAAKHHPRALKAIMVGAPVAPGIDAPMEGNVFWNFIYPWPLYTTNNKTLDNATYSDTARWARLDHEWYSSGRRYRDLDRIDGTPNPIFDRWIGHPSYDAYWQSLIPYKEEFSQISIPVLQTAGYYYGGPGAAVYYLSQHTRYRPDANHYLVIGPYDHLMAQRGTATAEGDVSTMAGYEFDQAAKIDLVELRFRWFDYVLKGAPKPEILEDRINYQVAGANRWKHAPSLAAMSNGSLRYYLSAESGEGVHRLNVKASANQSSSQMIDFSDRRDIDSQAPGGGVQDKALDSTNGLVFISEPLKQSIELSGLFRGRVDFIANKRDFDFQVALYELTPANDYIQLAPYWARASYVKDLSHRNLLLPQKRQSLDFQSMRLMSRQVAAGSRLVAVVSVLKESGREINYGTGKPVAGESMMDAKVPLKISWFADSFIDFPVHR